MSDLTQPPTEETQKPAAQAPGAAAVDVQAEINKALEAQQRTFTEAFKAATGHDSLEKFQEHQAKARGEHEKLLDQRNAELTQTRAELAAVHVEGAILRAAGDAVDPATVVALLAGRAKYEGGHVTVDGKAPAEAVAALLKDKPFLARPGGPAGGGAPASGSAGAKTKSRAEFEALDPAARAKFMKDGGNVV